MVVTSRRADDTTGISLSHYMTFIRGGKIPPLSPRGLSQRGLTGDQKSFSLLNNARRECIEYGLWTVIDQIWTSQLAGWIGDRRALEIMSGPGWLARALSNHGVKIIATDNGSWEAPLRAPSALYGVFPMEATQAVRTYPEAEILLCSWPPYEDNAIVSACNAWGPGRPIVYIGEGPGGCNAPDEFFFRFRESEESPSIDMQSWAGIYDNVLIGYWCQGKEHHL